jgi:DNA-binding transcriptional regulator YhcF (GntR family)
MTGELERIRFRREVDALGFAMIYHVLTLDRELSDGAFRLYALLVKYARQSGGCWPGIERLAADLDISQPTVKRRFAELVDRGLVTRDRRYGRSSVTWLEDLEPLYHEQLKNELFEQPFDQLKNDTIDQLKNDTTEEQTKKNKQGVGGGFSEEQNQAFDALAGLGVEPGKARRLAGTCKPAEVLGWVAYAQQAQGLTNPAAFVVARLMAGELAPTSTGEGATGRRRFVEGEYAEFIKH